MSKKNNTVEQPSVQIHRKNIMDLISKLANKHAKWQIWDDFIFFTACSMAQAVSPVKEREEEYLRRVKKYSKDTMDSFCTMFTELVNAFERERFADILGDMYMQLEMYNQWHGQYFTPYHISVMMAKITLENPKDEIEQKGYISVCDPCCGGGAMLIAAAQTLHEEGINYQDDVLFVAQDIDSVVARMCYIQMSLLGMPGVVIIGDTLLNEQREVWYTPMYVFKGFRFKKQKEKPTYLFPKERIQKLIRRK